MGPGYLVHSLSSEPQIWEQQCLGGRALAPVHSMARSSAKLCGHRKGTVLSGSGPGHRDKSQTLEGLGRSGRYQQGEGARVKTVRAQHLTSIHLLVWGLIFLSTSPCILERAGQKITQDTKAGCPN